MIGLDVGGVRLPLVEAGPRTRRAESARPSSATACWSRFERQLRVLPLGGLGEIGKNMTVLEYDERIVVVDTGLMFPTPDQLGIDLVLPDFTYLREHADDIEAIVLTHGHEDHVGALPFVAREIGAKAPPVYGGPLTIEMVRSKLDEHKLEGHGAAPSPRATTSRPARSTSSGEDGPLDPRRVRGAPRPASSAPRS